MNEIQLTQDYVIHTPSVKKVYLIQKSDWDRIKNFLILLIPEAKIYSIISSLCFGISISAAFSFFSFINTLTEIPSWVAPAHIAIIITSVVLGGILIKIDFSSKKMTKISSKFILNEMEKIEEDLSPAKEQSRESISGGPTWVTA